MGIGDWGLAQSPIPNPQSPNPHKEHVKSIYIKINLKLNIFLY